MLNIQTILIESHGGEAFYSLCAGVVTKSSLNSIEITSTHNKKYTYSNIRPLRELDQVIEVSTPLGFCKENMQLQINDTNQWTRKLGYTFIITNKQKEKLETLFNTVGGDLESFLAPWCIKSFKTLPLNAFESVLNKLNAQPIQIKVGK